MKHPLVTRIGLLYLALFGCTHLAHANNDIDQLIGLGQARFRLLSEDLGAGLSYKGLVPAEPLGITGFDIGLGVTSTKLENPGAFAAANSGGDGPSSIIIPRLSVQKGLPFGIDVGTFYSAVPDSNIKLWGVEARYALLSGGVATPAVALRANYSTLQGVDQLDLNTTGADILISKGITVITPYAGIGKVWVVSTPAAGTGLQKEDFSQNKYFVGANLNFVLLNIAVEVDKTGEATSYGAKFGWRF